MAVQRRGAELADRSAAPHLTNHSSPSCRQPITAHLLQIQRAEVPLLVAAERHDLLVHHQLEVAGVAVAAVLPPPGSQSEVSTRSRAACPPITAHLMAPSLPPSTRHVSRAASNVSSSMLEVARHCFTFVNSSKICSSSTYSCYNYSVSKSKCSV